MKIAVWKIRIFFSIVVFAIFFGTSFMSWAAEKEKKIVVTPFQINAEEPLGFLEKGIQTMLETRLAEKGRSSVVFAEDSENASVSGADYIIEGTILIFGGQVSTNAKLLDAGSGEETLSFSRTGDQKGDVIKHVALFADEVKAHLLKTEPVASSAPAVPPVVPVVPPTVNDAAAPQPAGVQPVQTPQEIWRGPSMDKQIDSLVLTDIDNDGHNEILILAQDVLEIYRRQGNSLVTVSETPLDEMNVHLQYLDAIDLDQDGQKELCITGVNEKRLLAASFVYRLVNLRPVKVVGPVKYLCRVVDSANGPLLLGQLTSGEDEHKLKKPVLELQLGPDRASLIPTGKSFAFADNVFGIAFGDFLHSGSEDIAVLGLDGIISIYSRDGKLLHRGSDDYGGSAAYIEFKGSRYSRNDGYTLERIFFQQRIFAADVDGKTGLVAVKNFDSSKGLLGITRVYSKSRIDTLLWNGLGLVVQEKGQSLSGYISDFYLGDTNADTKKEVVFALVTSSKVLRKKKSQIISITGP